ncbi:cysteine desulfurase CsdA [Acerihabitans sp. TG2]|uniref:cysteine desulfurase CsdA n=1 Tax=Acerihabitans sp. TG2 TaxID=3096008 RepID=UPI002B235423|nr:cysteine desulfurase CsdA [Acerihabitans sp. TG2]MEA9392502.1 cysteine desulfurase CsdA [Acerihabitans sp. TG2]
MAKFDVNAFRRHFPALRAEVVYLDSAATALKPDVVIEATDRFYRHEGGNVHRSQYQGAISITEHYEQARVKVASWINAPAAQSIVWTRGTTESINLVAQSYARPRLLPNDEILVSEAEHHANLIPWLMVAQQTGAKVIKWPLGDDLLPDRRALVRLLNDRTRIVAISQMSNVTGGCPDLADIVQVIRQGSTAVIMLDGAQGVVHRPPDLQRLGIDFYAFSGHKLYGPTGIGVLYGTPRLLSMMPPWQGGGKMLTDASFSGFTPQDIPLRFEAGTPNIAGAIGLGAALDWLGQHDMAAAEHHSAQLAALAEARLAHIAGFRSFRCADSPLLSFEFCGIHHQDIATILAKEGIALRAGQHCAQPLMAALGVSGTLRASFAPYNTVEEVDRLVLAVEKALFLLRD